MNRSLMIGFVVALVLAPLTIVGCKGKVDKEAATVQTESTEAQAPVEDVVASQAPVTEPAAQQTVSQETIPPTAAVPTVAQSNKTVGQDSLSRNKEIQTALKAANVYTGSIDGKMGPKTKKAIVEFQKAHGLKADGKVGSKTWMELEKYLTTQQ